MRMRALVMLGLAVVLGLASVFLLQRWLEGRSGGAAVQSASSAKTIVVARTNLAFGATLSSSNLSEVEWPAGSVPQGSFAKIGEVVVSGQDRVALQPIEAGEPILAKKVSGLGGRATLSNVIDENMRAMTIRVNDVLGVAGFVLPGDRVDVLLTQTQKRDSPVTDILLQNVRVLGIDQDANVKKDQPVVARAVTLEVSPTQAQQLTLGATVGTLSLALRNATNAEDVASRTIGVRDLRTGAPAPTPVAAAPQAAPAPQVARNPTAQVRVLRGTKESEVEVRRDGAPSARAASR
jgi:pilus assembly protein CpaB